MKNIESKLETVYALLKEIKAELKATLIMKSEDGFDLHEGDHYVEVALSTESEISNWYLNRHSLNYYKISSHSRVVTNPSVNKAFYSVEAANKWVEEHNKPKKITIEHFAYSFVISKDSIQIYHGDSDLTLNNKDINEIYQSYKSINI